MQDKLIPDSAITASSSLAPSSSYGPENARLHLKGGFLPEGGWVPLVSDRSQWLQINFGGDTQVTGIATQGYYNGPFHVKSYTLQYVDDRGYLQQYRSEWHTKVNILKIFTVEFTMLYNTIVIFNSLSSLLAARCPCGRSPAVNLSNIE